MGFPTILSTLQPFQSCIFNRKNSKLTFSNGSQLMGKRFMANLHASIDNMCKSKVSKISTRCQNWGSIPQLLILNSEINLKFFPILGGSIPQLFILNSEMKWNIFPILGGSIPQLFILNSEMKLKSFPILGGSIPQLFILNSEMNLNFFQYLGVHFTTFYPKLWNEVKNFSNPGRSIPQLFILNSEINFKTSGPFQLLILNSEMKVLHWYLLWGFLQY